MSPLQAFLALLPFLHQSVRPKAIELTFELADKDESCFYEDVEENVQIVFEFEVASGGKKDIDCTVTDPKDRVMGGSGPEPKILVENQKIWAENQMD